MELRVRTPSDNGHCAPSLRVRGAGRMVHSNVRGRLRQDPGPRDSSSRRASSAPGPAVPAADLQVSLCGLGNESGSCFIHCTALLPFSDPKWPRFKGLTQLWAQGGVC